MDLKRIGAMMLKLILSLLLCTNYATAGLPPTTSKASGDSTFAATFNFAFPNFDRTRTGTTTTFGKLNVPGGGTGATSLTSGAVLLGNGAEAIRAVSGTTSGDVLAYNGSAWTSQPIYISQARSVIQLSWTGTQTTNHNTDTTLTYSGATFTKLEYFTHSNGVFTATKAGDFKISCGARQVTASDASTERQHIMKLYKNASTTPVATGGYIPGNADNNLNGGGEPLDASSVYPAAWVPPTTVSLAVGDTFRCKYYTANDGGTNRSINAAWVYVEYFPTTADQATSVGTTPALWSGYHDTTCSWGRTNTAFGDFTADASCALTQSSTSNISCVATGSVLPALSCTFPRSGTYQVCANFMARTGTVANGIFRMIDGSSNTLDESEGYLETTNVSKPFKLCGHLSVSGTTGTVTLQGGSSSGTLTITGSGSVNRSITWTITNPSQNFSAPLIQNSVTSNTSGQERIERANFNMGASCTLASDISQSGSWITGCTRNGTGDLSFTFAGGTFSSTPSCIVQVWRDLANTRYSISTWIRTISSTAIRFTWAFNDDQGGSISAAIANVDDSAAGSIICMGPR